jgi:hypothetical protein
MLVLAGAWLSYPTLELSSIDLTKGSGRLLALGGLASLTGAVLSWNQSRRLSILEGKARDLEEVSNAYSEAIEQHASICQELIRQVLSSLAAKLALGDSERVSLYGHNGNAFVLAGRFSKNPLFAKAGRPSYPDDQGCIGRAWQHGECFVDNLPDPILNKRAWATVMEDDWEIPRSTSNHITMKSRAIYGCAFDHSSNSHRTAVLIIESTDPHGLNRKRIAEHISGPERIQLSRFLEIMETFAPNLEYAKAEGY